MLRLGSSADELGCTYVAREVLLPPSLSASAAAAQRGAHGRTRRRRALSRCSPGARYVLNRLKLEALLKALLLAKERSKEGASNLYRGVSILSPPFFNSDPAARGTVFIFSYRC
jgi:hypothetical protein